MAPPQWAVLLCVAVPVGVLLGKEIRKMFVSQRDLRENDAAKAERDAKAKVPEWYRERRPEWMKRVERKWLAVGRLGESQRSKRQRAA